MKIDRFHRLTALLCALALLFTLSPAVLAAEAPAVSSNINGQDYTTYGHTVKSYLYANAQGGLTRVEYIDGKVVVEDYDGNYHLTNGRSLQAELPIWGGFFAGKDANFLIFGQENPGQSNSAEVIRVVKYSKDWQRQGQASLKGANTTVPFDAGSLRCDEYGGYLYIRTCHEMYKSKDGYNHQSNLTMAVRQSDMSVTDSYYDVMNSSYGYISHSFNQFLLVDESGKIVTLDHGDAYPRGVVFCKYYADAGSGKFTGKKYGSWCSCGELLKFAGSVGNNTTGGSIGGLAETTDCYVMAYNYDGKGGTGPRDAYYHYMDKASGKSWSVKLTSGTPGVTTPVLAPTGLGGGYVMWNGKDGSKPNDTLYYLTYEAKGTPGKTQTAKAPLSDCQPVYFGGRAVWYVTNHSAPTFYGLDASGVTVLGRNGSGTGAAAPVQPTTPAQPAAPGKLTVETSMLAQPTFCRSAAVTANGDLYQLNGSGDKAAKTGSGYLACGDFWTIKSDGTVWMTPEAEPGDDTSYGGNQKVTDNVFSADTGNGYYGPVILKNDHTMWTYSWKNRKLIKEMENVRQIYASFYDGASLYALTAGGDLYKKKIMSDETAFTKIASGIAAFDNTGVGDIFVIKKDGALYYWGSLNDGDPEPTFVPIDSPKKLMDDAVCADAYSRLAINSQGIVYGLGKGTSAPKQIMDGAVVCRGGLVLKADGSLWSVDYDYSADAYKTPVKVLDNVKLPGNP